MPRAPRIEFAGAVYHVMNRGDHFEPIFKDDEDRRAFLKVLGETSKSSGWKVHAFVLMNNHYHLLIETTRPTLVKGMQYLNSTYTQRFNARHKQRGHLFQGRYKALLVDVEEGNYFLTVSDYIHLNPIRAKTINTPEDLLKNPWSSAGWLGGVRKKMPDWLEWKWTFGELGHSRWDRKGRKNYRCYLERRVLEEFDMEAHQKIRRGSCFGGERFVNLIKEMVEDLKLKSERSAECWSGPLIEEAEEDRSNRLLTSGLNKLGYKQPSDLKGLERYLIAKHVRDNSKVRIQWLSDKLNVRTRGGLSHMIYWTSKKIETDPELKRKWKLLI